MPRVGSILKRWSNKIFSTDKDLVKDPSDVDSDSETMNGYQAIAQIDPRDIADYYQKGSRDTFNWYINQIRTELSKDKLYDMFTEMDRESPELSSALDIYADNAVQSDNDWEPVIKIDTKSAKVKKVLTDFIDTVKLNDSVWTIARDLVKYGEHYEELVVDKNIRPCRIKSIHGKFMVRNEDEYRRLKDVAFLQRSEFDQTKKIADFRKWQITHFRMIKDRAKKYGIESSVLFPAMKVYKQICMIEDSMVIARLSRAQMKYAHAVDVSSMSKDEALEYIDRVKKNLKKRRTIDPRTGKQDLRYNPLSAEEDIFYGVGKDGKGDVKVLQGDNNLSNIKDVYYFQRKLFSATKVPKAYVGLEEDVNAKGTVTEQEIQFARSVRRLQMAIIAGLKEMFDVVLSLNGIAPSIDDSRYRIILPSISQIDELRKWQARLVKMQVAQMYKQNFMVNSEYLMRVFLNMTDDEIKQVMDNQDPIMAQMQQLQILQMKSPLPSGESPTSSTNNKAMSGGGGAKSMGGAGNKPPVKNPTDTKHNTTNSTTRKTQRKAGTKSPGTSTGEDTEYTDDELVSMLFTETIDNVELLLSAIEAFNRQKSKLSK